MPDFRETLQAAAEVHRPVPPPFGALITRHRHWVVRRRLSMVAVAVAVGCVATGIAATVGDGESSSLKPATPTGSPAAAPTPCVSPYAVSGTDVFVAVPPRSSALEVKVSVGSRLTVGWSNCGEGGQLSSSDPTGAMLLATDATAFSKGGPVTSVRYLAEKEGTVTITGRGSEGSRGRIVITIVP